MNAPLTGGLALAGLLLFASPASAQPNPGKAPSVVPLPGPTLNVPAADPRLRVPTPGQATQTPTEATRPTQPADGAPGTAEFAPLGLPTTAGPEAEPAGSLVGDLDASRSLGASGVGPEGRTDAAALGRAPTGDVSAPGAARAADVATDDALRPTVPVVDRLTDVAPDASDRTAGRLQRTVPVVDRLSEVGLSVGGGTPSGPSAAPTREAPRRRHAKIAVLGATTAQGPQVDAWLSERAPVTDDGQLHLPLDDLARAVGGSVVQDGEVWRIDAGPCVDCPLRINDDAPEADAAGAALVIDDYPVAREVRLIGGRPHVSMRALRGALGTPGQRIATDGGLVWGVRPGACAGCVLQLADPF